MADFPSSPTPSEPERSSSVIWTIVRVVVGGLLALAGFVSLIGSVDTDGAPSVACGGPAVSVAFGGGHQPEGRTTDCRTAGRDQALGGGLFLVVGGALILGRRLRRWSRSWASHDLRDEMDQGSWRMGRPWRHRSTRADDIAAELVRRAGPMAPARQPEDVSGSPDSLRQVEDPGWRPALIALVPIVSVRIAASRRRDDPTSGLVVVRQLFLSFVVAIAMLGFVLTQLDLSTADASMSTGTAMALVGAVAFVALVLGPIVERPLDGSNVGRLAETWRTRFFVRVAFGEASALVGFAGAFLAGSISPYVLGASATAVMFTRAAPSARNIEKDQEGLNDRGSLLSLVTVLAGWSPKRPDR